MLEAASQPLYTRVYRMIADDIASGRLRAGDRLPAERELCQQLSVSRTTVRRAFAALVEDGLIESAAGRGAFVTNDSLAEPPNALMSFSELGASRGLHPTSVVLTRELRQATIEQAELLLRRNEQTARNAAGILLRRIGSKEAENLVQQNDLAACFRIRIRRAIDRKGGSRFGEQVERPAA